MSEAESEAVTAPASAQPTASIPLFRRFPALASKVSYISLGAVPTPIEKAEALGAAIGVRELYIKRDDLAGSLYGGNKTRKLEFFLADAIKQHKKTVVTSGAVGSNHALATALHGRALGLRVILLLMPQPPSDLVRRNLLAEHAAGAELRLALSQKQIKDTEEALIRRSAPGDEPYIIEAGGSSPLGDLGYVNAAFELADQIAEGKLPAPDRIYITLGTMGSAVGLRMGVEAAGLKAKVIAVRASTFEVATEAKMIEMYKKTNEFIRSLDPSFPELTLAPGETGIKDGYLGAGYTIPTPEGKEAIRIFKQYLGIDLEPTYTGKTLAALLSDAPKAAREVVVFWDTYNSRPIDAGSARPEDLPAPLRAYFKGAIAIQRAW